MRSPGRIVGFATLVGKLIKLPKPQPVWKFFIWEVFKMAHIRITPNPAV